MLFVCGAGVMLYVMIRAPAGLCSSLEVTERKERTDDGLWVVIRHLSV